LPEAIFLSQLTDCVFPLNAKGDPEIFALRSVSTVRIAGQFVMVDTWPETKESIDKVAFRQNPLTAVIGV
jgi:hypothetical protein